MIKCQLRSLIAAKEMRENRRISYREIEAETSISSSTLSRLGKNKMRQFNDKLLSALCHYFNCQVGDILQYQPGEYRDSENASSLE